VLLCIISYAFGYYSCAILNMQALPYTTVSKQQIGDVGSLEDSYPRQVAQLNVAVAALSVCNNEEKKRKKNGLILPFERTGMKLYLEHGNKMTDSYTYFHNYLNLFGSALKDSAKDFDTLPLLHIWPVYFEAYHNHWQRFRGKNVVFMEIGVQSGGKIPMLRDYFGPGLTYVGVDINKSTKKFESADWIHIEIGSSEDLAFLATLKEKYPKVDLFLDDGGHTMKQQRTAMKEMFPHVQSNGVYMCEDLSTSWAEEYQGYSNMDSRDSKFLQETMVGLVHRTMDWFQGGWIPGRVMDEGNMENETMKNFFGPSESWFFEFYKTVKHIHYYNQLVVYEKGYREPAFAVKTVGNEIPGLYSGEYAKVEWGPILDRVSNYTNSEWN